MKIGRILIISVAAACMLAVGYAIWQRAFADRSAALMTATVSRGDVEETVLATGTLKPARLVAVGAQASGRITSVKVALGDTVAAGDLIAEIDSISQQNSLSIAEAALANTKAQLAEKRATYVLNKQSLDRQRNLLARNTVSRAEFDSAEAALKVTEAQIAALEALTRQAEVSVEAAQDDLDYTRITAPTSGTVLMIVSQEGQTVNATQSAPTIVILGQLDTMTVRTEISEADITKVKPGLPVYFTILGDPDRRFAATLESIEPAPESIKNDSSFSASSSAASASNSASEAVYYNGVFNVPNEDGDLRTYMTAQVHIVLGEAKDVLTVPAAALGTKDADGLYTVRVVGPEGTIAERKVEIGLNDKVVAEVLSGLAAGGVVGPGEATASAAPSAIRGGPGGPPMGM